MQHHLLLWSSLLCFKSSRQQWAWKYIFKYHESSLITQKKSKSIKISFMNDTAESAFVSLQMFVHEKVLLTLVMSWLLIYGSLSKNESQNPSVIHHHCCVFCIVNEIESHRLHSYKRNHSHEKMPRIMLQRFRNKYINDNLPQLCAPRSYILRWFIVATTSINQHMMNL